MADRPMPFIIFQHKRFLGIRPGRLILHKTNEWNYEGRNFSRMNRFKKNIILCMAVLLFLQVFTINPQAITPFTSHKVYEGLENGQTLLSNISFTDIGNHWARESIQEVAALALMNGVGYRSFNPNGTLTHGEAITTLVRAIGKEAEAQVLAEQELPPKVRDFVFLTVVENWANGYVQVALNEGILTQDEINQILNISPQQLATLENQVATQLEVYSNGDYTAGELNQIRNQIRNRLLNNATWNKPVTRQQVSAWLARALGLEPSYGENIIKAYSFTDWNLMDADKLPLIESLLQKGWMQGISPTTFSPRGTLIRGQMAQLIVNVHDELLDKRGLTKKTGTIYDLEVLQQQGVSKNILTIENDDNSKNIIVVTPTQNKDFVLQNNGILSLSTPLKVGNRLTYYINSKDEVIYAKTISNNIETIEGFIDYIDVEDKNLIVVDFNEKRHLLQGEAFTTVKVNGEDATFKDLFNGQEVIVHLIGQQIKEIEGFLDIDPSQHGYISPGSRTKVGSVLFISSTSIELNVEGKTEKYRITSDTEILRGGGRANLFEIKEGDRVLLTFDDIYTTEVRSIQVEDSEKHITALYRGSLEYINEKLGEIILNKVSVYENGKWNSHPDQKVKLKVEGQALYLGGNQITIKDLTAYKGKEAYIAAESSYGVEKVAKLLVKEGSLVTYEDKISDIKYGNSQMVVDKNIFTFHPGTIVVKNNRLVDVLNLEKNQNIYLAGSIANGTRNAAVVAIEYDGMLDDRVDGTKLAIYRGKIEDIGDYGIKIGRLAYYLDYLKLDNNKWTSISKARQLTLTEDTYIFDSDIRKEIEAEYLINSRFIDPNRIIDPALRNRIRNNYYIGKSAYVVVKETTVGNQVFEEVLSLNLTPNIISYGGMVNIDHSAIGEIDAVDLDTNKIIVKNIKHWNSLNSKWESVRAPEEINLEKSVILLNDKPLDRESLYLLKERAKAYIIKSKNVSTGDDAYVVIVEQ